MLLGRDFYTARAAKTANLSNKT